MNKILVVVLTMVFGTSLIACDKKKPTTQQSINACLYDPSGNCQRQVAMAMQSQQMQPVILPIAPNVNNVMAQNPQLLTGVPGQPPGVIRVSSVDEAAIRQQYLKVQSQIAKDESDPRSLNYNPERQVRTASIEREYGVTNSLHGALRNAAPASAPEPAPQPVIVSGSGTGSGEAIRERPGQ